MSVHSSYQLKCKIRCMFMGLS